MIPDYSQHTVLGVSYTAQYKLTTIRYKQYTVHSIQGTHHASHMNITHVQYTVDTLDTLPYTQCKKLTYTRCNILPCH